MPPEPLHANLELVPVSPIYHYIWQNVSLYCALYFLCTEYYSHLTAAHIGPNLQKLFQKVNLIFCNLGPKKIKIFKNIYLNIYFYFFNRPSVWHCAVHRMYATMQLAVRAQERWIRRTFLDDVDWRHKQGCR